MVGLVGDRVYDVKHHGGSDQAVYAYAREDLDQWEAGLGKPLANGIFGENLTTAGLEVNGALIGERWRIGPDVVLEVSCPRIPCATFQGWLERGGRIKRFTRAAARRIPACDRVRRNQRCRPSRDRAPARPRRDGGARLPRDDT